MEVKLSQEVIETIENALKKRKVVEVKVEKENVVVIEINRTAILKSPK